MSRRGNTAKIRGDVRVEARRAIDVYLKSLDDAGSEQPTRIGPQPKWHAPRPDEWTLSLVGSSQQTINVELSLGEYTLQMVSFLMRGPDENFADVYRVLLRRSMDYGYARFAVDDSGDIFVRAVLPILAVDGEVLDRAIGEFYSCADTNYTPIMRLGFASAFREPPA